MVIGNEFGLHRVAFYSEEDANGFVRLAVSRGATQKISNDLIAEWPTPTLSPTLRKSKSFDGRRQPLRPISENLQYFDESFPGVKLTKTSFRPPLTLPLNKLERFYRLSFFQAILILAKYLGVVVRGWDIGFNCKYWRCLNNNLTCRNTLAYFGPARVTEKKKTDDYRRNWVRRRARRRRYNVENVENDADADEQQLVENSSTQEHRKHRHVEVGEFSAEEEPHVEHRVGQVPTP